MNQDQAGGKWDQIKGRAKKAWGELTDDDFKKAEGSMDKLLWRHPGEVRRYQGSD
jgi:uncharacterized protein YjbJ (UPF0337 family)